MRPVPTLGGCPESAIFCTYATWKNSSIGPYTGDVPRDVRAVDRDERERQHEQRTGDAKIDARGARTPPSRSAPPRPPSTPDVTGFRRRAPEDATRWAPRDGRPRRDGRSVHYRLAGVGRVTVRELHVGLDLLFLIPGETGGRETYAVELIHALAGTRRRPAPDGVRQPGARRGAGLRARPARDRRPAARAHAPPQLVGARRGTARACVGDPRPGGSHARPGQLRPALRPLPARAVPARPDVAPRAAAAAHCEPAGRARADRGRRETSSPGARELGGDRRGCRDAARPRSRADRRRAARPRRCARRAARSRHDAARCSAWTRGRTSSRPGLALPHKNLPRLVAALSLIPPERRPQLALTAGGDHGKLAAQAALMGVAGDVRVLGWLEPAGARGCLCRRSLRGVPVARRGLRAAGARGDDARRPRPLLRHPAAARGRR